VPKAKEAKKLIQIQYVQLDTLKEWNRNPRRNDPAVDKLSKLIELHGFINPVIATEDNVIRAGHTRCKAAKKAGLKEVPVIFIDMEEKQAQAYAIADNKSNEWSEWDFSILKDIMEDLDDGSFDMDLTGFDTSEIENLMTFVPDKDTLEKVNGSNDEWVGMPEFGVKEDDPKLIVRFRTEDDRESFVNNIGLDIQTKLKCAWNTWFPYKEKEDLKSLKYE